MDGMRAYHIIHSLLYPPAGYRILAYRHHLPRSYANRNNRIQVGPVTLREHTFTDKK